MTKRIKIILEITYDMPDDYGLGSEGFYGSHFGECLANTDLDDIDCYDDKSFEVKCIGCEEDYKLNDLSLQE